ncbi:unnamed protein product, partial [Aphanomyces euteiches]
MSVPQLPLRKFCSGSDVSLFKVGDEVYYAGSLARKGSYAEYQAVDERIVGHKPKSL